MYNVKIKQNPAGYGIYIKKHWWSRWKIYTFAGMSSAAIDIANVMIDKK